MKRFLLTMIFVSVLLLGTVPLNVKAQTTLAESINNIANGVNWTQQDFMIQHAGIIFHRVSTANYGDGGPMYTGIRWKLRAARLSEVDGTGSFTSAVASSYPQVNGIPNTLSFFGMGSGWMVYERNTYNLYTWDPVRWNRQTGLATLRSLVPNPSDVACGYMLSGGQWIDLDRYYDEYMETADSFLGFGDVDYAKQIWQADYDSHWNGQYWSYRPSGGVECEAGGFAMLAAKLYMASGKSLPYFDTVAQDLSYKFTVNGWGSALWGGSYVCTHAGDVRLRLQNTQMAWGALQMFYPRLSSSDKSKMIGMLTGSTKAWQYLLASPLYQNGKFATFVGGEGPPGTTPLDQWTTTGLKTLFLLGIVPDTGSLAIPLIEENYEDVDTWMPATHFQFDYQNRVVRVAVNAGTLKFQFGNQLVSHNFGSSGIYEVHFSNDWNTISNTVMISGLSSSFSYLDYSGSPLSQGTGSISVSADASCTAVISNSSYTSQAYSLPHTWTSVQVGSYTVTATFSDTTEQTKSVTVSKDQTASVVFTYGEQPNPWQWFIEWLRERGIDSRIMFLGMIGIVVSVGGVAGWKLRKTRYFSSRRH